MFATQTTAIGTAPPRPSKRAVTASPADSPTRLSHRGFTARVLLSESQTPCPVYRVEYDAHNDDMSTDIADKRIITCWIPSVENQTFSVSFGNAEGEEEERASCGHVFVDGNDVASAILRPGRTKPAIRHGVKLSQTRIKPFMFSKLKLTDDESLADPDDPRTQDIGTIRIEIKYIRLGDVVPIVRGSINEIGLVHEKAKKAGVHTTTFQSIKRIDKSRSVETAPLYPDDEWEHHVVFVFRYRSADMLMAQGIMPRPVVPPPPPRRVEPFPGVGEGGHQDSAPPAPPPIQEPEREDAQGPPARSTHKRQLFIEDDDETMASSPKRAKSSNENGCATQEV